MFGSEKFVTPFPKVFSKPVTCWMINVNVYKGYTEYIFKDTCPHSLVLRALDLKTRGCGFASWAGQPNNN